ncbi:MAG: Rpp14/Pop5 family protein [Nanobdellota archaeon]
MREKKRYLVFKIESKDSLGGFNLVSRELHKGLAYSLGSFGIARAGISILPDLYDQERQEGIIRTSNRGLDEVRAALACITYLNGIPVLIHSLGVSGILKKAKSKFMEVEKCNNQCHIK